ncbi:MAG: hypothetical protein WBB82_18095 [Limnothrix sp.]
MSAKELARLDKSIERLKDQLAHKRDTLVTIAPEEKARIKQQIEDLRTEIRDFEREKWELLAQLTEDLSISNEEAETIVAEIVTTEGAIIASPPTGTPPEVLTLLQRILDKLSEPESNAAAKLKGAFSTFPPFIGITYEAELDTEQTLRRYFPTFRQWARGLTERLKK